MNERLDYILALIFIRSYLRRRASSISESFEKAGYGSIYPYLQRLIESGYVEQESSNANVYKLNEKGVSLHYSGGFVHKDETAREKRVALICSVFTALVLVAFLLLVFRDF